MNELEWNTSIDTSDTKSVNKYLTDVWIYEKGENLRVGELE